MKKPQIEFFLTMGLFRKRQKKWKKEEEGRGAREGRSPSQPGEIDQIDLHSIFEHYLCVPNRFHRSKLHVGASFSVFWMYFEFHFMTLRLKFLKLYSKFNKIKQSNIFCHNRFEFICWIILINKFNFNFWRQIPNMKFQTNNKLKQSRDNESNEK